MIFYNCGQWNRFQGGAAKSRESCTRCSQVEKWLRYWCSVKKGERLQNCVGISVKCFASENINLLELSFLGLFVCFLGLVEVLWASILGCRTECLAEVKLGIAISSVGNWAPYCESIFCPVSSLQFSCSINNDSDSSAVGLCWGHYSVHGTITVVCSDAETNFVAWTQLQTRLLAFELAPISVKYHQKSVFPREQNVILSAINLSGSCVQS